MTDFSYEYLARQLRALGFNDLREIDECMAGFYDDQLSRYAWGTRQGQIIRFELMLLAGMGENYKKFHPLGVHDWFIKACERELEAFQKHSVPIRSYCPSSRKTTEQGFVLETGSTGGPPAAVS
jgi:hypothetical protein